MVQFSYIMVFFLLYIAAPAFADGGHHHHAVPTLNNQTTTKITIENNTVTLTFGPVDLPSAHDGDLAASMPKHVFQLPKDMYMVGYNPMSLPKTAKRCRKTISITFSC